MFDYFINSDDEVRIKEAGINWELVMELYHKPILQAGLLTSAFFMPKWQESNGAKWERDFLSKITSVQIEEIPEEWIGV